MTRMPLTLAKVHLIVHKGLHSAGTADLGAGIVQNARFWLVGLHGGNVDDGPTLGDVLGCRLCYAEVGLQSAHHTVNPTWDLKQHQ